MKTYEPQYQWQVQLRDELGPIGMGLTSGSTYIKDPRRLVFLLSRYKFASKILDTGYEPKPFPDAVQLFLHVELVL